MIVHTLFPLARLTVSPLQMTNKSQLANSILLHYQLSQSIISNRWIVSSSKVLGGTYPLVLQPDGEAFRIRGFAYLHGLMHAQRKDTQVQVIRIC